MDMAIDDLVKLLGEQIRALRLRNNITQVMLAAQSDVSIKALRNLENGSGATVTTLLRVLRTLGRTEWIDTIGPKVGISPMQMLTRKKERLRATGERKRGGHV